METVTLIYGKQSMAGFHEFSIRFLWTSLKPL